MELFDRVYIEISNICNLQCTFCPVVERDKKVMLFEDFKKIILDVKSISKQVCLHLMGEPLAHPEFRKILEYCLDHEVVLQITTNGLLVEKYKDLLVSKNIRQINFSIQSYKDNFPNKPLADYLNKVFSFTQFLMSTNPETYINYRLWNVGLESNDNDDVISAVENEFKVLINKNVNVSFKKSKKVINRLYLHFDSRFDWPSFNLPPQGTKGKCYGLVNHFGIHADGTVVPCCLDKEAQINLGNVFETSIHDILNSERARKMKEGFQNNIRVEKFCQHCTFINRF